MDWRRRQMTHYQQIIVNMVVDNSISEADLEILKQHIEKCIEVHADPEKIHEVKVRVN
ncbi:MAG: hypothetical protein IKO61_02765 [Lachnospiraceae bacterium]|nr:hypothetical protein [Lachnospiraceae bacterium]